MSDDRDFGYVALMFLIVISIWVSSMLTCMVIENVENRQIERMKNE